LNIDSNKNTKNIKIIKIAVENANLCGTNMRYADFVEVCENCGSMRNMQQLHIRVNLTCLLKLHGMLDTADSSLHAKAISWLPVR